eukprot:TRINITY_DN29780_c1_g2_i1.p1 TRINITY_DN29780_c1_g2~~TRINITY_DN29780_c1_g2_i1.p1  ORF type:complete len:115 (-),score=7.20 TRINITY_DN29780_c1_g2_i1:275-574(-)
MQPDFDKYWSDKAFMDSRLASEGSIGDMTLTSQAVLSLGALVMAASILLFLFKSLAVTPAQRRGASTGRLQEHLADLDASRNVQEAARYAAEMRQRGRV